VSSLADDRAPQIVARAERLFSDVRLERIGGGPGLLAIADVVGPDDLDLGKKLSKARTDLANGRPVKGETIYALQAAIRTLRPAVPVRGGGLVSLPDELAKLFGDWEGFRQHVRPYLRSVARIDRGSRGTLESAFATGFLVTDGVLLTNAHVVETLTLGTAALPAHGVYARFGEEHAPVAKRRATPVKSVIAVSRRHDLALLEVPRSKTLRPLVLSRGRAPAKTQVAAIGYPSSDRQAPEYTDLLLDSTYGVERVSPGEIMAGKVSARLFHDCTTLGGNSGSPVVDLSSGEVLGVHSEGFNLARNEAVPARYVRAFLRSNTVA
jgi:S1-C subfamily serine protease